MTAIKAYNEAARTEQAFGYAQQMAQLNREAQLPTDPFQLKFAIKDRLESELGVIKADVDHRNAVVEVAKPGAGYAIETRMPGFGLHVTLAHLLVVTGFAAPLRRRREPLGCHLPWRLAQRRRWQVRRRRPNRQPATASSRACSSAFERPLVSFGTTAAATSASPGAIRARAQAAASASNESSAFIRATSGFTAAFAPGPIFRSAYECAFAFAGVFAGDRFNEHLGRRGGGGANRRQGELDFGAELRIGAVGRFDERLHGARRLRGRAS